MILPMPRLHTDLHYIPAHLLDQALKLLLDNKMITRSEKDIRFVNIRSVKNQYPSHGAFIEVQSYY